MSHNALQQVSKWCVLKIKADDAVHVSSECVNLAQIIIYCVYVCMFLYFPAASILCLPADSLALDSI